MRNVFVSRISIAAGTALVLFASYAGAQPMKASLAQMPVYAESVDKGILVDLVKAISEVTGKQIDIQVVPFKRSIEDVTNAKVDFHMPLIKNPNIAYKDLNYLHSTETIFHVNFTLYTNKSKPLDMKNLGQYKIETDAAHTQYFAFPIIASSDLESSIKKVDAGRIDGLIFADMAIDPLIAKLNLTNVKRELYYRFDVKIILPKNAKSKETDAFLTAAIKKLRESGKFAKIMGPIDQPFKP